MNTQQNKLQEHSKRSHALLSASGASRWLSCTPSAKLEDIHGEKTTSPYAAEGTLAHELSELFIARDILGSVDDNDFNSRFEEIMSNELFSDEMLDVVPMYVEYCQSEFAAALQKDELAEIKIEQKLDLSEYVPESFGTADCVIVCENILQVIDLKYGKGVPVYAHHNKQGMLYALGALRKYDTLFCINTVKITIVQPRINNISTWEISVDELLEWANNELKPKAALAFAGEGELVPGEHCKFCSVKNKCRALYEEQLKIAKYEFQDAEFLTDEEISDILERAPQFIEWVNSITEYAQKRAIEHNKVWPGFKLVAGLSRRRWLNDDNVIEAIFTRFPEATEDQVFNTKLKSISEIEKTFGKKRTTELLSDVIIKPEGKPTLVPVSDKRPALGIEDAISDFK
jgi:hypothetical protein